MGTSPPTWKKAGRPLTVTKVRPFDSYYGVKTLVVFEDEPGNLLNWWASCNVDHLEEGDVVTIKATVKEHGDYKGTAQTIIKRVKVEETHEQQAAA